MNLVSLLVVIVVGQAAEDTSIHGMGLLGPLSSGAGLFVGNGGDPAIIGRGDELR